VIGGSATRGGRGAPAALAAAAILAAWTGTAAAASWSADRDASRVEFVLHTFWHDVHGTSSALEAALDSASGDPLSDGRVSVSVDAASLVTGIGCRDRKMRERHLEVATYPRLEFRSTAPPRKGSAPSDGVERPVHLTVEGDLAIHGVTKRVAVSVEARADGDGWVMKGALVVKLSDYGVPDPGNALNNVKDDMDLGFEIRFRRRSG